MTVPLPRAAYPVLVADAGTVGAIAVIRSLGRAGYPVHAVAPRADALGLHSRFAREHAVHPPMDSPALYAWLDAYLEANGIRLIIPSEGLLRTLLPHWRRYAHLLPVPDDESRVRAALSKFELFSRLSAARTTDLAPTLLLEELTGSARQRLAQLPAPVFLKADADLSRGLPALVERLPDPLLGAARAQFLLRSYPRLLIQAYVPGHGVGVFLCRWQGRELAAFMHRRVHEVPHTGGVSSLRQSWCDERMLEHARGVLDAMGWQGVAMLEYRRDPTTGRFWLIEMNARFWGSLHLALHAGVDFPLVLVDALRGEPHAASGYRSGVLCRNTIPGEVQHVWSKLKDDKVRGSAKAAALAQFVRLSLDPRVHEDLLFAGDRRLYFRNLWHYIRLWVTALRR